MSKPRILIFSDFFLPGFKSGGGMRTVANTVRRLGEDFDFFIVSRDHDGFSDRTPYPGIAYDTWNRIGKISVWYLRKRQVNPFEVIRLVRSVNPDAVYLNSIFSTLSVFFFLGRLMGAFRGLPVGLAPCGELGEGALGKGRMKKAIFLSGARALNIYRNAEWRATDASEQACIEGIIPKASVSIVPDIATGIQNIGERRRTKSSGELRLLFLSRLDPIKNLEFVLEALASVRGRVELAVVGSADDAAYELKLRGLAASLRETVSVNFVGPMTHHELGPLICDFDFLVLPTLGENFGHAIVEALSASLPVVISDRTPWRDLESKRAGFDLPLEDRALWNSTLNRIMDMDDSQLAVFRGGAGRLGRLILEDALSISANGDFFRKLSSSKSHMF